MGISVSDSRCAPAACGEGVTLRSPCPCCWRCSTTQLPLLALLHPHAPSCSVRSVHARARRAPVQRARARHCTTCIEALKPTLRNGGQRLQGFNAESSIYNSSIVSAKLRICQVQGGNSGVQYGTCTVPRRVLVPVLVWYNVNVNSTSAPHLQM